MRPDPDLPLVFSVADTRTAGMTHQQVARRVRSRRWTRLRGGVYCRRETWDGAGPTGRLVLRTQASVLAVGTGHVVSHSSAAALHGLPTPRRGSEVWLTHPPPGTPAYQAGLRLLVASLPPADVERLDGRWPVTSLARTVADCLRHLDPADAVAVGDAALHRQPSVGAAVVEVLARCAGWPYAGRAADRLPLLDGRRESPLESASAVVMHRAGIPRPEAQAAVFDGRRFVGRADFWWPELGVVGEADGHAKYGELAGPDVEAARRALVAEKLREDDVRGLGLHVVRWGWRDLDDPGWPRRLAGQLRAGRPTLVRARVVVPPLVPVITPQMPGFPAARRASQG